MLPLWFSSPFQTLSEIREIAGFQEIENLNHLAIGYQLPLRQ